VLEAEKLNTMIVNASKVYVKMDLLYRIGERYVIVDWKTGKEKEDHSTQLFQYAKYVSEHYGVDPQPKNHILSPSISSSE